MVMGMGPQAHLERWRNGRSQEQTMQGQVFELTGSVPIIGIGEATREVNFPISFIERPQVFGSGALDDGEDLVDGFYPTWRVGVASYETTTRNGTVLYTAALLVMVVTGVSTQRSVVSWSLRGKALRNPVL
jgi:hypothetical protein